MPGRRRKSNTILPLVIASAGGVLILIAVLWLLYPPAGGESRTADAPAAGAPIDEDVPRASLADAKAAFDTGTAIFVDVRGEPYYSQSHIPGALSIPLNELPERLDELDRSAWIITYCT